MAPILAGRVGVERRHRREVRRRERPDPGITPRSARQPGRLEDAVPGLDLEPEPFVHRPAGLGGDEDERPAPGVLGGVDGGAGQLEPDAVTPPRRVDEDRSDPGDRSVEADHARPDDRPVGVGDERLRLGMFDGELEAEPSVTPILADEQVDDGVDVGSDHRPDDGELHPPMVAGRRLSSTAMATLSRSDVEHVAHLARLGLTDAELARLEVQLNHILDQYAILAELPTDDIPPTAQTIELENILRDDVVRPSLPVEAVLANAPARDGDFIVVPAILDER